MKCLIITILFTYLLTVSANRKPLQVFALDLYRVFKIYLYIGACVPTVKEGQNGFIDIVHCRSHLPGKGIFHKIPKESVTLSSVKDAQELYEVAGGLCDGFTYSSLGLLRHSDCVSVELAKHIPFNDNTHTVIYAVKYRQGFQVLPKIHEASQKNYADENTKYVTSITHGVVELLTVTMHFNSSAECDHIKKVPYDGNKLYALFEKLRRQSKSLHRVTVGAISTFDRKFKVREFPQPALTLAPNYIETEESRINKILKTLKTETTPSIYHINYRIGDYIIKTNTLWANVTNLEVWLYTNLEYAKDGYDRFCRRLPKKHKCRRLSMNLQRCEKKLLKYIHAGRQRWYLMNENSQRRFFRKKNAKSLRMVRNLSKLLERIKAIRLRRTGSRRLRSQKIRVGATRHRMRKTRRSMRRRRLRKSKKNAKRLIRKKASIY